MQISEDEDAEGVYLPSEEEIWARAAEIRWLRNCGWLDDFVRAVIVERCPRIDLVRYLVTRFGQDTARLLLEEFFEEGTAS